VLVALFDKTGVHGKKFLKKHSILYLVGPFVSTSVSWLCAWFRSVFAFGCNSDSSMKNLDKTSYYPELESKTYVKRSASNFSQQLEPTFSFKASNSELKLHKCSKEAVEKSSTKCRLFPQFRVIVVVISSAPY
jgi:hypothetical protein